MHLSLSNFRVPAAITGLVLIAGTTSVPEIAAPAVYDRGITTYLGKWDATPARPDPVLETASSSTSLLKTDALERRIYSRILGEPSSVPGPIASTAGCWDVPLSGVVKSLAAKVTGANIVAGTYGMIGHWCHDGNRATAWQVLSPYGETSTPGYNYKGQEVRYYNAGWEVRMVTQFHFTYGVPTPWGVAGKNQYACLQLRGGPGGHYSTSTSCSLN